MPQIVYIDITTTATETPSNLQQMGAIVSLGGTTLTTGAFQAITSTADFTAIASSTAASGVVNTAVTNFYQQGSGTVYILELGAGSTYSVALDAYISANPQTFYAYHLPGAPVDTDANLVNMCKNYVSQNSMTYFFFDCTLAQVAQFNGTKSVFASTNYSGAASTETSSVHAFYEFINASPTSAKKLAPFAFRYMYGLTPWPERGNQTTFANMKAAYLNFIGTGAQGGVSDDLLFWGYFQDGKPASYWYAVDLVQINLARDLAYEIITGSNSTVNPLVYNQPGITRLQARAATTLDTCVSYGCIVGAPVVSAVDFGTYVTENPGDYATGTYNGLSATITPMRGFEQITFYLNVDFSGTAAVTTTTTGS